MSAFDFNIFRASEQLLPPQLRRPKMIAWLRVLLTPISYLKDIFRKDYIEGSTALDYNGASVYTKYNRVVGEDFNVYELKVATATGIAPTGDADSSITWRKLLSNHIGADERILYNNQIIVLEYALNRYFRNPSPADQIYILNYSPWSAGVTAFSVYVPVALHTSLGGSTTARNNRIKAFVDRYNNPAYSYTVVTF